ncbi:kinase [Rhizoctonia solani AG-3 Rhs1AP]|uniref:non-specific serine/threonine protein kinase n=1 Tax=Rhizoctonia solani AG-3 Rhs1AP TaxID=1086054 RepID=X8IX92_9AGAM|nr:kinase [Rhizoctonia solani AG-3 Rhs1AP]
MAASNNWLYQPSSEPKPETSKQHWIHDSGHSQTCIPKPAVRHNDIYYVPETRTTIRRGIKLGSGGFGHVFSAIQSDTQRVVALKQCRASLKLKRPLLQHEARVLKILSGHPNIPEIYAYGRIEHFELLSMQLLHRSLRDVVQEDGPLSVKKVANLAHQMMDVLQHVHSHGLVHRDIKPDNIMLQDPDSWTLCLIDFGLARPSPSSRVLTKPITDENSKSTSDEPARVFGTLPFASLNAHEKDSQLAFRDDLESLAYTLLWLLRGVLPWSHYAKCGTRIGRIKQVFTQKKRHNGATLAIELPAEFGELVDYARSSPLDEKPEYAGWKKRLKQVECNAGHETPVSECRAAQTSAVPPELPVEAGQIVLVKLDPSITAEGHTMREGHESSFIPDPIIDSPEWSTAYRPAVIVKVEWDKWAKKHCFFAIAISRESDLGEGAATQAISIATAGSAISLMSSMVHTEPGWPLDGSYFYVFRQPVKFYCLPSQERVHSMWKITQSDCDTLLNALTPPPDSPTLSRLQEDLKSPETDIRHDARMVEREEVYKLYAQVHPLALTHLEDNSIDWFSRRAWFDECVKVARYRGLNIGIWWTGAWFPAVYQPEEGDLTDSYSELDYSMWEAQSERRKSITLAINNEDMGDASGIVSGLTEIIALEQDPESGEVYHGWF